MLNHIAMKTCKNISVLLAATFLTILVCSCDQHVITQTKVYEDGGIERTIILNEVDSAAAMKNSFGVNQGNGWEVAVSPSKKHTAEQGKNEKKFIIAFTKKFPGVAEANAEFSGIDSVMHIRSAFEKKFRWFYTYISYNDTFESMNRFKNLPVTSFFAREDFDFIERLPAEGKAVSRADSIFLDQLMSKIYDQYVFRALFEDHYHAFVSAATKSGTGKQWLDTLAKNKQEMYAILLANDSISEKPFMPLLVKSLSKDFPTQSLAAEYERNASHLLQNLTFMTDIASYDKFMHVIDLPGELTAHNADSVNGNMLYYKPVGLKFMLNDHVMHAESRSINYWAFVVSGLVIVLTVVVFVRKR
jgi:hypothetical protein